nr:antimicrobial protein CAP18 isoform X2 [Oryctolagus cuniculus]
MPAWGGVGQPLASWPPSPRLCLGTASLPKGWQGLLSFPTLPPAPGATGSDEKTEVQHGYTAIAQDLTYREAVLRAVDAFNQQSSEANLYRLLSMDPQQLEDAKPYTPQPVSFTVKETECPRTTWKLPEQCDFKEDGLVKRCVGTVTRYQAWDSFDIRCNRAQESPEPTGLRKRLRKFRNKIKEKLKKIGQKIQGLLPKLAPRTDY